MSRKMRPISPDAFGTLPSECEGCVFWETPEKLPRHCGTACDPETLKGWATYVQAQWGDCGRAAFDDGEILGFIKYAPPGYFPQAAHFPAAPPGDDAVFLACLHVVDGARHLGLGKLLLHAAMRDLIQRGEKAVEAYAFSGRVADLPVMTLDFLLQQGFQIVRPHPEFPLMRLDFKSLATVTENVEAALQRLHLPMGRVPNRMPAPNIDSRS